MRRPDTELTLTAGLGMADLNIPGWPQTTDGTPLVARCLLLDDGATRLVIVSLTVIALRRAEALLVREAVAAASDIPADHVMVACTHVHSGPPTFTGDAELRRATAEAIAAASARAAQQAADVQPARLGVSTDQLAGVSRVRRVLRHDGSVITLRRAWPEAGDIHWIIDKAGYKLLDGLPGVRFHVYDKASGLAGMRALRRELAPAGRFDVFAVDPYHGGPPFSQMKKGSHEELHPRWCTPSCDPCDSVSLCL